MKRYTWDQQRRDIKRELDRFFGCPIDIAPRAMASLQTGSSAETVDDPDIEESVFEYSVLESLLTSSPACSTFLFKAGANLEQLRFPATTESPAPFASATLDWIFRGVDATELVPCALNVKERKLLNETDIMVAALEASLRGAETNEFGGCLLKAANLVEPRSRRRYDPAGYDGPWADCDKYLTKLVKAVSQLAVADPSHALVQYVLFEDEDRTIRIRPFGATDLSRVVDGMPLANDRQYLFRGGVLQPLDSISLDISSAALEEFEHLLNSTSALEQEFQDFFEKHPLFLTGLDFRTAQAQPILYMDEGTRLIPDFFLEKLSAGWDAILDIKRPYDEMVSRRRHRVYFRQHVQNAISQLRFYREWFDSLANRKAFDESYGIKTFRPKMVIVIGRRHHFRDDVERVRLMEGLPQQLDLWTYDDVLERAHRYLALCGRNARTSGITKP